MIQNSKPNENFYNYKNLLFFMNDVRDENVLNYLNTFPFNPPGFGKTVVVNGNELYFLNVIDNIFTFYSIDGKYLEMTISLLQSLTESISNIIKDAYDLCHANFISFKLCCYLPSDKKVPFGFVHQSDNNSTDLYGNQLLGSLSLYTKIFEFDNQYELKTISFEHLIDYTEMIAKFVKKNNEPQTTVFKPFSPSIQPQTNVFKPFAPSIQPQTNVFKPFSQMQKEKKFFQ